MSRPHHKHARPLAALFALAAILLRSAVPAGFMVAPAQAGSTGAVAITLCGGQGDVVAWLGPGGDLVPDSAAGAPSDQDRDGDGGPAPHAACVFATSAQSAVPPATPPSPALVRPAIEAAGLARAVDDLVPGRGLAAPPPPATAPPHSA